MEPVGDYNYWFGTVSHPVEARLEPLRFKHIKGIDLFSLYVLLPHFRPRDSTVENHCFQILKYLRAYE